MRVLCFKLKCLLIAIIINSVMDKTIIEVPNSEDSWELSASKGDTISVKIRGNKTTGYNWFLLNADKLDKNLVKPLNLKEDSSTSDYKVDDNPNHLMGVGGYFYFDFKIADDAPNQVVELEFSHRRSWEPIENQKIKKARLTIGTKSEL